MICLIRPCICVPSKDINPIGNIPIMIDNAALGVTPTAPIDPNSPFTDVPLSAYYHDAVLWALEQGITTGTGKDTFDPNGTCTSAHVVTFLWRASGKPTAAHTGTEYYAEPVAWATEKELLAGTDVAFAPNNLSPRADIVTYLYRFMNKG